MILENNVRSLIDKAQTEKISSLWKELDGTDFGLYLPIYADGDTIKPLLNGMSQTERDLVITISKDSDPLPEDTKPVAWFGNINGQDVSCNHPGGPRYCSHCNTHGGGVRNCTHPGREGWEDLDAPQLNYNSTIEQLINYRDLLRQLAAEGYGIALLHGHSEKHMFTKLPEDYVSVISNGVTTFRKIEDVKNDNSFVPNMWRMENGVIRVAGGYSSI